MDRYKLGEGRPRELKALFLVALLRIERQCVESESLNTMK
jgi:hypothetical protein